MGITGEAPVAIVSGGGTGMGLATAAKLLALGYQVTAAGTDREDVLPPGLVFERLDVTDDAAVAQFARRFPRVDALVNAAGMLIHNRGEYDMSGFRRVLDVNLNGTAALCFAFHEALTVARGAVVKLRFDVCDLRFASDACLRGKQRRRCTTDEVARCRLGAGRRSSERCRARLDRDAHLDQR